MSLFSFNRLSFRFRFSVLLVVFQFVNCIKMNAQTQVEIEQIKQILEPIQVSDSSKWKALIADLRAGNREKIHFFQLGDSHIQPDISGAVVRKRLQETYGNGGRGLIFPYTLAKTHGSRDFWTKTNRRWTHQSWINNSLNGQIGVLGFQTQPTCRFGRFAIHFLGNDFQDTTVVGKLLFEIKNPSRFQLKIGGEKLPINESSNFQSIDFKTTIENDEILVQFRRGKPTVFGVWLENSTNGITWNTIGVGGARIEHLLNDSLFKQQFATLQTDVIVLSMGTNESFLQSEKRSQVAQQIDEIFAYFLQFHPNALVLVTAPAENYYFKNGDWVLNPRAKEIRELFKTKTLAAGHAYWDLHAAMGGEGGMLRWFELGLVHPDHIHFLSAGNAVIGELFANSLEDLMR